jgi:iron complex transport system substrate-binding protein
VLLRAFLLLAVAVNLWSAERLVALSPSVNEILFALGAGERIVANTEYCNYPPEAKAKPKVGGYFSPSVEKIIALKPTMVIMQENNAHLAGQFRRLGISVEVVRIDTYPSIRRSILRLGKIVRNEAEGERIVQGLDRKMASLRGIVKNQKILMVFGHNTDLSKPLYVSGQNLYFDDIIRASGNVNALQSRRRGQPVVNLEQIIGMNPDIVVLLAPNTRQLGLSKEELISPWRRLPINAVRHGRIYVADGEYSNNPSHRLGLFLNDYRGFLLHAAR